MRLWLGIGTFLVGSLIWFRTGFRTGFGTGFGARVGGVPARTPAWVPRLGLALGALGVAVMASTRSGPGWTVSSICFALIAVILLSWVLSDNLRRR